MSKFAIHLLILWCFFALLPANSEFTLEEVADTFPYKGFEDRIEFWKDIFAKYGERDLLFHDEEDVRLIYHLERLDRDRNDDAAEIRRQKKYLQGKREEIESLFDQIIRLGADSQQLNSRHRRIIKSLQDADYSLTPATLRKLRNRIRYQRGIKERFRESLKRSGMYLERMKQIFAGYGLPEEIAYLPHIESSFDYNAYSKAGAVGVWQFTRGTGRNYLRINRYVDERRDPIRATDAAARLITRNYAALGSWPLAITGYNHGRNGMLRAKKRHGSDFLNIIANYKSRYFGFASKNFYAEFLAALVVAKNYEKFFGPLEFASPLQYETVRPRKAYASKYFTSVPGLSREILSEYNPHLRRVLSGPGEVVPAGVTLRVPVGKSEPLEAVLRDAKPSTLGVTIAADGSTRYRVRRGDVLSQIAAECGTSVRDLKRLNGLRNANRIQVGQVLLISPATGTPRASSPMPAPSNYRVKRGDNLTSIARRMDTTVEELALANNIKNPDRLKPGMTVRAPGGNGGTRRYRVRRGDTLAKIARRFGTSVSSIKTANQLRNPNLIKQGQELLIP